jgi:hypothetical protein
MTRFEDQKNKPSSAPTDKTALTTDCSDLSTTKITQKKKISKKRNWACVVYPESLPADWLDILQKTGLQIVISPLHNKDKNPDGTVKKPHYHIILIYSGPTSFSVVQTLTQKLNAPAPIPLEAVRGYYRYLTHKDNPEKVQYDEKEIKTLNGFSILDFIEMSRSEVLNIKKELIFLIMTENFIEYADFINHLLEKGTTEFLDVAMSNTYFFDKYLSSRRHRTSSLK